LRATPCRVSPLPLIPKGTSIPLRRVASDPLANPLPPLKTQVKILIDTGRDFKQNIEMEIRAAATHFKLGWDGLAMVYLKMPWN